MQQEDIKKVGCGLLFLVQYLSRDDSRTMNDADFRYFIVNWQMVVSIEIE